MTLVWARASALMMVMIAGFAHASGDLSIEGRYIRNQPCHGNGSDPADLAVTISEKEIAHSGGTCTIDSRRMDGDTLKLRLTCRFRSGSVLGADINFSRRDDNSLNMAQQDGSYRAVLYRCPK